MTLSTLTQPAGRPDVDLTPPGCHGCHRDAPRDGALLCTRCGRALHELAARIRADYGRLELQPGRHGTQGAAAPVGFASKPPLAVAPLSLQYAPHAQRHLGDPADRVERVRRGDPDNAPHARDAGEDTLARPGEPTLVVVGRVADRCREHELLAPLAGPRTVVGETLRLERVAGDVARAWWAGAALAALRSAARDLARALGEDDAGTPLGGCPEDARGGAYRETCKGRVRALDGGARARCSAGHEWRGEDQVRALAAALGDAWSDPAALAAYVAGVLGREVTADALRKRAARQGWPSRAVARGRLYRLTDARWSYGLECGPTPPPTPDPARAAAIAEDGRIAAGLVRPVVAVRELVAA